MNDYTLLAIRSENEQGVAEVDVLRTQYPNGEPRRSAYTVRFTRYGVYVLKVTDGYSHVSVKRFPARVVESATAELRRHYMRKGYTPRYHVL